MKVAVTGAAGFLGWHARCNLKARGDFEVVPVSRMAMADGRRLSDALMGVDAVLHLAGVNRAQPDVLRDDNFGLAKQLTASLDRLNAVPVIVYANSIQSGNGEPFGDGKEAAAEHLLSWGLASGAPVADVRLPNLFGEHGRPHYNSVVATFSYELARDGEPIIQEDREIPLLHAQDAVDHLVDLVQRRRAGTVTMGGQSMTVSDLLHRLSAFRDLYVTGDIPDLVDPFDLSLFNTYRSFCFPDHFPIEPPLRSDVRGQLFECVRGHGGQTQVFCSSTNPGFTRGQHFHLRKVERFLVLRGTAEIELRRLFGDQVIRFKVAGDRPAIVDMPTMWAHSITNTGSDELMTLFWANEILDPDKSDTFPELVIDTTVPQ
jgi:UDP-2-acetamido-2,6-beta-L-arabino-hexul-4-ose reductase